MTDEQEGQKKKWFGPFHASSSKPSKKRSYLIVLNTPIRSQVEQAENLFEVIWKSSEVHICADGGANRLFDFTHSIQPTTITRAQSQINISWTPDYIIGDLDSIRPQVKNFYETSQSQVLFDADQDTTDLGKSLKWIQEVEKTNDLNSYMDHMHGLLLIHGGLSGRLDQTIHTLHTLLSLYSPPTDGESIHLNQPQNLPETWVIDTDGRSMACALQPGYNHLLHIPSRWRQGPHPLTCGILPLGITRATVSTNGLKWDLINAKTRMTGLLSTSNHILPETDVVKVKTDETVIWTMEIPIDV